MDVFEEAFFQEQATKTLAERLVKRLQLSDWDLNSSLVHACASNDFDMVKCLLDQGADVNFFQSYHPESPDTCGRTALVYAFSHHNHEPMKLLTEKGAETDISNSLGYTPSEVAKKRKLTNEEFLEMLRKQAANDPVY